ncbi:Sodium/hydrogen exchanger family-domain-containing protein [Xylaria bambusicola]|uniref:Sodium/hydrogen exchanger family-domain-containing protein n=1 Tax=Xylaria bambusicola TaxID=326684 RepID=UPI0020081260|nr:Sodium/hydrogen exchanger family-domain-containing protein [Xylaria bambusicola]KAI0518446.1 Sodium/hydrogen exchanger family-domain-containing protein [Xylaria bambusicola]
MPTLDLSNFNIVVSVLGGWISLFGLVSYLLKENFYLSEALISLLAGITFGPLALNWVRPIEYARSEENLENVTLFFTRLVLGVQLVLAGVQLPSRYLKKEWKPLALLLGPIMTAMWLATSLLIWGLVPHLPFLHALAIGACVTPTDPVLSNVIVKGKFADHNIPKDLQKIIIAESGANDGLGYPFLFLALYLIKYIGDGGVSESGGAGLAIGLWFGETWGYTIILSTFYGAVVGWLAKRLLRYCKDRGFVDRESFLVFALSLALFITGTCGLIGSDDILACFIAGNVFTWDDWFRLATIDDSLQPTIDMLLNVVIFMWYGAVCPWRSFVDNSVIPIYRLIPLGILVLILRRPPFILTLHKQIPQIEDIRQATFMGFFGPIGCSAIFYLYVTVDFIETLNPGVGDEPRHDVAKMAEAVRVIVWFMVVVSVVVHGLSIPLGKVGVYLPRSISRSRSMSVSAERPSLQAGNFIIDLRLPRGRSRSRKGGKTLESRVPSIGHAYRIGGSVIVPPEPVQYSLSSEHHAQPEDGNGVAPRLTRTSSQPSLHIYGPPGRTVRFPDEASPNKNQQQIGVEEQGSERSNV